LPPERRSVLDGLVAAHPNITAIDVGPILAQIQHVLEQVIGAVQFLFAFTLVAGVLVLYAALAGTRDERMRESALLRALGASHRQVLAVHAAEFAVVGALAGLMAAIGAQALGSVLATRVFDFYLDFDPWLLPAGIVAGIACAGIGGWVSLRRVLERPAAQSLRDA
jgi:putative ABC transport system permease protein